MVKPWKSKYCITVKYLPLYLSTVLNVLTSLTAIHQNICVWDNSMLNLNLDSSCCSVPLNVLKKQSNTNICSHCQSFIVKKQLKVLHL